MRTLVPALIPNHYRPLAQSLHFPDWPGADEEKETLVKKKKKVLEALKHKRPRRNIKYPSLEPRKSL